MSFSEVILKYYEEERPLRDPCRDRPRRGEEDRRLRRGDRSHRPLPRPRDGDEGRPLFRGPGACDDGMVSRKWATGRGDGVPKLGKVEGKRGGDEFGTSDAKD